MHNGRERKETMLAEIFGQVLPVQSTYKIMDLEKDAGVVFTAQVKSDSRIAWTLPELLGKDHPYTTAATFFGRKRQSRYVRHLLAFVSDFDTESDTTPDDILDRYHAAGLPLPELMVATATQGHYQAWNVFEEPLRMDCELIQIKVRRVHEAMTKALGADTSAVGVERWVRRPTNENTVYVDAFARTPFTELCAWYDARRIHKVTVAPMQKVTFIGTLLSTPAGQLIQQPVATAGKRNEWAYGLGLCLYDAGIPAQDIRTKLYAWNDALEKSIPLPEIEKIFRSVMSGRHHASARVLEAMTGRSARIIGWYKWAKPRDRRQDHLSEVRRDILADLWVHREVTETQKAWAARLGVAYRTLKQVLAELRDEGIVEAEVGRGRFAYASYKLSDSIASPVLQVAAGAEATHNSIGHTANSPLKGGFHCSCCAPCFLAIDSS